MTKESVDSVFKRAVTIAELLISVVLFCAFLIGVFVTLNVNISNHELRIKTLEDANKEQFQKIDTKIDKLVESVNEIKVGMASKQDKTVQINNNK